MISREKVYELVKLFYPHTFKTFYVNSVDGNEFVKPIGVFVSLGLTTKFKTLENIKDFIASDGKCEAKIVEITSKKVGDQFMNTIYKESGVSQYRIEDLPDNTLDRDAAVEAYKELEKQMMDPHSSLENMTEVAHKIKKLKTLIDNLDETGGWNDHIIMKDGDADYKIFHLNVNYTKREGVEYRLGIFVDEK